MAKYEIHSGDADLGRPLDTDTTVGDDDDFSSEGLRVRTLIFLQGRFRGDPNDPVVNRTEATTADEGGLVETTTHRLRTASGCGHVLHTAQEMGLQCTSCIRLHRPEPNILCTECANDDRNSCAACNTIVCHECRQQRWMDGELKNVCRACVRTRIRWQFVTMTARYAAVAAGLFYLLFG
jgi:hypothetical protein